MDDVDEQRVPAQPVDGAEARLVREVRHVTVLDVDAEVHAGEEQEQPGDDREVVRRPEGLVVQAEGERPEVGCPGGRQVPLPFTGEPDASVFEEAGHIPEDQHEVRARCRRQPVDDLVCQSEEQDTEGQQVQNAEPDLRPGEVEAEPFELGKTQDGYEVDRQCDPEQLQSALPVGVGQPAGDAAEEYENAREDGLDRTEELVGLSAGEDAEGLEGQEEPVVEDHAEDAEPSKVVHEPDAVCGSSLLRRLTASGCGTFRHGITVADYTLFCYS